MADISQYKPVSAASETDRVLAYRAQDGTTVSIPVSELLALAATAFTDLSDVPGSYKFKAGQTLAVNAEEDGLEFVLNNLSPTFQTLPDTPTYPGNALRRLRVNAGETALEYSNLTFLESADTPATYSGQAGASLRVNEAEDGLVFIPDTGEIPNIILVDEEADLPAVNGSGEHELEPGKSYWFTTSFTLANPLRFISTDTEVFGNGIGNTKITYTGAGHSVRATNGAASIRLRALQIISSTGDGIQFVGGGSGSGTNVSLDRAYIIAALGEIGTVQNVDIYFADAAVLVGAAGLTLSGANNGLFYSGTSRYQSTATTTLIDFDAAVFEVITAVVIDFRGVAGSSAIGGQGAANLTATGSGQFNDCTVESGLSPFSGTIDSTSLKWSFTGNTRIPSSNTTAFAYIQTPATTNVVSGVDVQIAGTWAQHPNTERATVNATGEITFLNSEEIKGQALITLSANKLGGTVQSYNFKLQKDEGSGYVDVLAASKVATVDTSGRSITLFGLVQYSDGDKFRLVVNGVGTSDDIDVTVTQFIIG